MDENIFRFYGNRDFDLDSLANSYLWFSKIEEFNDPFEGMYEERVLFPDVQSFSIEEAISFYHKLDAAEWKGTGKKTQPLGVNVESMLKTSKGRYALRTIACDTLREETLNQFNIAKHHLYHCCFVFNKGEEFALENKLMWSHYGAGLRGFVVEYSTKHVEALFSDGKPVTVNGQMISYEKYTKDMITKIMYNFISGEDEYGIGRIINTKSPEWKYENEIRLVCEAQVVNYNKDIISSITIGERMSKIKRTTLLAIINSLGLDVVKFVRFACIDKVSLNIKIVSYTEFMEGVHHSVSG
jgi:hypothetical protein